jgi:non-ribosomal peptide synthetase component F
MTEWVYSMVITNVINKNDTVGQISRCTFDVHAQDIMGTLIIGGSLIMLRPGGILDFDYLSSVFKKKQITYIQTVPSLLRIFFTFLIETCKLTDITYLRSLCTSGERLLNKTYSFFMPFFLLQESLVLSN